MDFRNKNKNNDNINFKKEQNKYIIKCEIENNNINVETLFNVKFNFIQLIYNINSELFEIIDIKINPQNENEAFCYLLIKHHFKNLGVYQRYISLKINKTHIPNNNTIFTGVSYPEYINTLNVNTSALLAPIKNITVECNLINNNKFELITTILLEESFIFPTIIEQLTIPIFRKCYKNIKNILQNIKYNI